MTAEDEVTRRRARARAVDVARRAGASISTVSLVANGKAAGRISPQLQERVREAMAHFGYVVDRSASSLVTGRRGCVALVTRDVTNPVASLVAAGVAEVLGDDIQLMLAISGSEDQSAEIARVAAFGVDGILLHAPDARELADVPEHTPTVLLDYLPRADRQFARVSYDTSLGSAELARHLADQGHTRIAYLDSIRPLATFKRRRQSFTAEFTELVPGAEVDWIRSGFTVDGTKAQLLDEWSQWRAAGVTAIVAATDIQAYGVLDAFAELGVDVPGEVSVAAFDNLPYSSLMTPGLTAVDLPAAALGRVGATLLLDLINGTSTSDVPPSIQLDTELVVRRSTGTPRRSLSALPSAQAG